MKLTDKQIEAKLREIMKKDQPVGMIPKAVMLAEWVRSRYEKELQKYEESTDSADADNGVVQSKQKSTKASTKSTDS